jgi:hypothetical protein
MSPWYPVGWSALGDGRRHGAGVTHLGVLIPLGTPLELIVGIRYATPFFVVFVVLV